MTMGKREFTQYLRNNMGRITKGARLYEENVGGRKVTYYYHSKGIPKRRTVYFYRRNFMHLCGIHSYIGKSDGFYEDALKSEVKTSKATTRRPKYVDEKIESLKHIPKLVDREELGFSEEAVVHKGTSYGEMIRTQEDLFALGTIEDRKTGNLVPLSLINIEVRSDGVSKSIGDWSRVAAIRVRNMSHEEQKEAESRGGKKKIHRGKKKRKGG